MAGQPFFLASTSENLADRAANLYEVANARVTASGSSWDTGSGVIIDDRLAGIDVTQIVLVFTRQPVKPDNRSLLRVLLKIIQYFPASHPTSLNCKVVIYQNTAQELY